MLDAADRYIAAKQFPQGAQLLSQILASTQNQFYRQEAMYKLGQTYMLMGQYDALYYMPISSLKLLKHTKKYIILCQI